MKSFAVVAALAGFAMAAPQAVTSAIAPKGSAPAGCSTTYNGKFNLYVAKPSKLRARDSQNLEITLTNGVLTDSLGRTGYIASNNQFQFDGPVQAGAIYTSGWSVCSNTSLALGSDTVFYECLSGTFYNLYDENTAAQCSPIELQALPVGTTGQVVSQQGDGQPTAASARTVLCQITDGQVQQNTCTATILAEQSDGQVTGHPITQISDGQIQASAAPATPSPVTPAQQPAASPTGPAVSQASDGQIIASGNGTAPAVTAQSPTKAGTTASASAGTFSGAAVAPTMKAQLLGLAAGVLALAAL